MNAEYPDIHEDLARAVEHAARAWPTLKLSHADFAIHLAKNVGQSDPAAMSVDSLHVADLYLAYGCLVRDAAALTAFVELCREPVQRALAGLRMPDDLRADAWHELLERLVFPSDGQVPRLASYAGRGPLAAWVAVSARRRASNLLARRNKEIPWEEPSAGERALTAEFSDASPLKAAYRERVQSALHAAVAELAPRERRLLEMHLRGASFREIGRLHGVDKSTVFHWFRRIRERLRLTIKAGFGSKMPDSELASVLRMVRSQLQLGLDRTSLDDS